MKIALAQIAPILGDVRRNVEIHERSIREASAAGADLIVFPELSLTGYYLRDIVPDVAIAADAPLLLELIHSAGEADIVVGFVEDTPHHRFFNSALYGEAGQNRYVHRKVYLPTYGLFDESRYFAAGHRIQAFDTKKFGRVGILVCEDFWHLSAAAIMQAEEVDLLICVSNSPARGVQGPRVQTAETYRHVAIAYAQLLGTMVVVVNRAGVEDGLCFWGGSMVVGPDGKILGEAPQFDEALTLVDIDPAELRRERIMTPLGRDERLLLTLEELTRIKRRQYDN